MSARWLPAGLQSLLDRIADWWFSVRNRMLCDPGFQRWSSRFFLFRPIARKRAHALFDIAAGFVYSQVFNAVVRLKLLEAVRDGPKPLAELAPALGLSADSAQRLLDAAASLRLVERRRQGYGLGVEGCSYLGNPGLAQLVRHNAMLYRDLVDPVALLRGERPDAELNRFWTYASSQDTPATADQVAPYSELMASSIPVLADDVLEAYPITRHRRMLDVAGGEGAFIEAVAAHAPEISLHLFDLPAVAERAEQRLSAAGLSSRVTITGGDAFADPLPAGADLVSLVRVLHDHDDGPALQLLKSIREAMAPEGTLLVAEPMRGTSGSHTMGDAYFAFYLLAMGQGRPRSPREITDLLHRAGFEHVRVHQTRRPMLAQLISARIV